MGNCVVTSSNSTRRSRRIAFALALAIVPVPGFAQELPAFPTLPAFPASSGDVGNGDVGNSVASKPMPAPYPFVEAADSTVAARCVVKILGLRRSQEDKLGNEESSLPPLPIEPSLAIAELPRNSVIASSSAVASAALRLNGTPASQDVLQASGVSDPSDTPLPRGNAVVAAAAEIGDELSQLSQQTTEAVVEAISDPQPSLSLIDIDIPLPQATPAAEAAVTSKAPTALVPTVVQAPQLPLSEALQLEPLPSTTIDKPIQDEPTLRLQKIGRPDAKNDPSAKQNRSTRNTPTPVTIGEAAVELTLSDTSPVAPSVGEADEPAQFSLSDHSHVASTGRGASTGRKESRFAMSDPVVESGQRYSLSDDRASGDELGYPAAPKGSLQTEGSLQIELADLNTMPGTSTPAISAPKIYVPRLPAPAKDERWGEPTMNLTGGPSTRLLNSQPLVSEPKPLRVYVEGEESIAEPRLAVSSANESQIPVRLSAASKDERPLPSSSLNGRSESEPVVQSGERHVGRGSNVVSAKAIAIEAAPPQLTQPQTSLPAGAGEMRQGPALVMAAEDAAVRQAGEVIRDLSVEHEHICRAIQTGPTTYSVLALQPGMTRIAVITVAEDGKQEVEISEVTVKKIASTGTASDINELARQISGSLTQLYPQYVIDVDVLDKSLLVQGEVGSEAEAKRVISLVRKASLVPVIDRLNSPEK